MRCEWWTLTMMDVGMEEPFAWEVWVVFVAGGIEIRDFQVWWSP